MEDDIKELRSKYWLKVEQCKTWRTTALCNSQPVEATKAESFLAAYNAILEDLTEVLSSETRSGI